MAGFYRSVLGEDERRHAEAAEATAMLEQQGGKMDEANRLDTERPSDRQLAEDMRKKGVAVTLNDEGQITDKRQLLSAGLNLTPSGNSNTNGGAARSAEHLRTRPTSQSTNAFRAKEDAGRAARERQTRQMEAQLEASAKRKAEEDEEERQRVERQAKSQKTEEDKMSARERFLARKKEREMAKATGKGG